MATTLTWHPVIDDDLAFTYTPIKPISLTYALNYYDYGLPTARTRHPSATEHGLRAERLLAELGSTPDEIADALTAKGVTGQPGSSKDCVLARYLRAMGLPVLGVSLGDRHGEIGFIMNEPARDFAWHVLPPVPNTFARRFDGGAWPALVAAGVG